jgi:hypothetical protein
MKIEVSNGEILDKLSILQIKSTKFNDIYKLSNVENERRVLLPMYDLIATTSEIRQKFHDLININSKLWDIEDMIRIKEQRKEFDEEFIELARSVYKTNDIRADIKRDINHLSNSNLIEEKSYAEY